MGRWLWEVISFIQTHFFELWFSRLFLQRLLVKSLTFSLRVKGNVILIKASACSHPPIGLAPFRWRVCGVMQNPAWGSNIIKTILFLHSRLGRENSQCSGHFSPSTVSKCNFQKTLKSHTSTHQSFI